MVVVANSTPLIALSRLGLFELLKEYFGEVAIPKEVYEEVVTQGGDLFGAKEVSRSKWIKIVEPSNRLAVDSLSVHLGKGEAEAIILAKEQNTLLIIDDKDGRLLRSLVIKIPYDLAILPNLLSDLITKTINHDKLI